MPTIQTSRERAVNERLQAHRVSDTEYRVYNTVKKTAYSVTKSGSGYWHCTCPFMTKGSHVGTEGVCKHLTRVFDKEKGCGRNPRCRIDSPCSVCKYEIRMLGE